MLNLYGSKICSDCVEAKAALEAQGVPFEYVEITESVANMRDFLHYRDTEPALAEGKAEGRICIPFLVSEDGTVSTDWEAYAVTKTCDCC